MEHGPQQGGGVQQLWVTATFTRSAPVTDLQAHQSRDQVHVQLQVILLIPYTTYVLPVRRQRYVMRTRLCGSTPRLFTPAIGAFACVIMWQLRPKRSAASRILKQPLGRRDQGKVDLRLRRRFTSHEGSVCKPVKLMTTGSGGSCHADLAAASPRVFQPGHERLHA